MGMDKIRRVSGKRVHLHLPSTKQRLTRLECGSSYFFFLAPFHSFSPESSLLLLLLLLLVLFSLKLTKSVIRVFFPQILSLPLFTCKFINLSLAVETKP